MKSFSEFRVGLLGTALGIAGLAWTFAPDQQDELLAYQNKAITDQGATLYADNCASCHGADLKGQANWRAPDADGFMPAPPHDETGHTWHHPDTQLIAITRAGTEALIGGNYQSRMIGFGDTLSDTQIRAVLAYIKSTWPQKVIDAHNRINSDAATGG
ncbi:MAG: mono/diheme cytochrome c family protein [Paracoccaceae bacterium]|jgi:mono/diheme cytochrome c family protein